MSEPKEKDGPFDGLYMDYPGVFQEAFERADAEWRAEAAIRTAKEKQDEMYYGATWNLMNEDE